MDDEYEMLMFASGTEIDAIGKGFNIGPITRALGESDAAFRNRLLRTVDTLRGLEEEDTELWILK